MSDRYTSLAALKRAQRKGRDYRIRYRDRGSLVTIVAPHGGYIEPGTSAIARAIADQEYNYFDFQGLQRARARELHVTATNFRDPLLNRLLKASDTAVAIHGMGATGHTAIWLGGLNLPLKLLTLLRLQQAGFSVNPDSPRYRGESPRNLVNLPRRQGVQLELPDELTELLFASRQKFTVQGRCPTTTARFDDLVSVVRRAIGDYLQRLDLQS